MNCPYCKKLIYAMTGFQEAQKFARHLPRCRKNPANIVINDGRRAGVTPIKAQTFMDALAIRGDSGQ